MEGSGLSRLRSGPFVFLFLLLALQSFPLIAQAASCRTGSALMSSRPIPGVVKAESIGSLSDMAFIRDPGGQLSVDEAFARFDQGEFQTIKTDSLINYGFTSDVLWFAFRIVNKTEQGSNTFLDVQENNLEQISVIMRRYVADGSVRYTTETGGSSVPFFKRPMPMGGHVFNAVAPPYSTATLVCRIQSPGPNRIQLRLLPAPQLFGMVNARTQIEAIIAGVLGSLLLINLFLFIAIKDEVYLWFVLHLLFVIGYLMSLSGQADRLFWPAMGGLQNRMTPVFSCLLIMASLLFIRKFLEISSFSKVMDRLILAHFAGAVAILILLPFAYTSAMTVGGLLVLSALFTLLVAGVMAARRKHPNSKAFLSAWSLLLGGAICTQITTFGCVGSGQILSVMSKMDVVGLMGEAFVFSFWLVWRLNLLKAQKESAEAKTRLKQSFIANISHEMRTPLNAIMGISEALQASTSLDELRDGNMRIHDESERLLFQINQVLDLAKLEADRLELEIVRFSPRDILAYLESTYHHLADAKGLKLVLSVSDSASGAYLGDPVRIEQVLRNLVDNAIKFTQSGWVSLEFRSEDLASGMVKTIWSVRDTGPGIAYSRQGEIFEEFVQGDSSITRRHGGTGLGTSIARKLIRAMGGELFLSSEPGKGALFYFSLTLPRAAGSQHSHPEPGLVQGEDPRRSGTDGLVQDSPERPRILVVDDYPTNIQVVQLQLKSLPVEIHTAASGQEALRMMELHAYRLVLLDVFMPDLSGCDVVKVMKDRPGLADIPVIGLTASGYEDDLKSALQAGMSSVLVKPVAKAELLKAMGKYLSF